MKSCLMVAFLSTGCTLLATGSSPDTDLSRLTSKKHTSSQEDDLGQVVSLIERLDSEPFSQLQSLLIFHLNRWIQEQPRDPEWILAPLVNRLPFSTETHPHMEQLQFHLSDVFYLHE
ncbi:MAG: hypothetical protein VB817_08130, partial [Pirellulaceae bacterium]